MPRAGGQSPPTLNMPCNKPYTTYRHKSLKTVNGYAKILFEKSGKIPEGAVPSTKAKIACGQCYGCRLEHSRIWAIRCTHEAELWEYNLYITLTYTPEELQEMVKQRRPMSLHKPDLQKFWKRLRKHGHNIRYYACGEYGDENEKPHYHAIVYNIPLKDLKYYKHTKQGHKLWTSETLNKIWGHGYVTIGAVTFESAAYVARYIMKKRKGKQTNLDDHYLRVDTHGEITYLEPEFQTMSRAPGIASEFYNKNKKDIYQSGTDGTIIIRGGQPCKPPAYYDAKYKSISIETSQNLERIKDKRRELIIQRAADNTPARLRTKETIMRNRAHKLLPRNII